ncbi:TIGR02302 family protein [Thalassobaculum sp. OXR-137]|uniref:TIGR02302 family protein n=1 Tax=Thalassobaculum sp. OXR-137 TaxID=3100173 RepID=UPI002AC8D128|nr:TIGR02302 family protein [Thalassobaculum sp. OXR-137]WPZ34972.1 TIGR02302 family protein [Thalassobaculum sp. OXR-137]
MRNPQTPDRSTFKEGADPSGVLAAKLALAKAVLGWERLWPSLWPPLVIATLFIALALIGVPGWIGDLTYGWGHLTLLVALGAAFLWSLRRGAQRWQPATHADAVRRLERDSGLSHRPLSSLGDRPADEANYMGLAIWRAHLKREAARLKGLKVGAPEPSMARLDRYGLRAGLAFALVLGLAIAAGNPGQRIAQAFQPDLRSPYAAAPPTLDVWINPPAYTGRVPMLLARAVETQEGGAAPAAETPPERLAVPVGSVLLAKVNGGEGTPELAVAEGEGDQARETVRPFETVGTRAHQIEMPIEAGTALTIRQDGDDLAGWTITVVPDLKPTVSMAEPPAATERAALMIHFAASDDYGLDAVEARIDRLDSLSEVASEAPIVLPLSLPGSAPEAVDAKDYHDLTPHPWAGQPVRITLVARDAIGQEGLSEPLTIILPERQFTHPVAQAIIEQRKRLTTEPGEKDDIAQVLMSIAVRPHHYFEDLVTFLALRTAAGRLVLNDESPEMVEAVQKLLWDTALRVEDGELSLAERELREIERKIMDLLAEDSVDQAELDKLMDELRQAIDKMLQAMAEQMQEMMRNGEQNAEQMQEVDPNRIIERQDLMDMLERAREMAQAGAKDAAREMLSQLRELMENLRAGRPQMMSPEQLAAREMMRQLQDLAEQQQRLMDETFKNHQQEQQFGNRGQQNLGNQPFGSQPGQQPGQRGEQGQPGQRPGQGQNGQGQNGQGQSPQGMSAEQLAQMQEQLRRQLGEFMRKLGEGMGRIPQPFGQAERAMKGASDALGQSQPGDAVGPQGDAIEALQDGAQALSEAMQQQQQAGGGAAPTPGAQGRAQDGQIRDPLNNDSDDSQGYATDGNTRHGIPAESDLLRSRRIFDELRRRSGERDRPAQELDYIDRLLKRF